jgi:hypothetical protein
MRAGPAPSFLDIEIIRFLHNDPYTGGTTMLPPGWLAEVEPSGSLLCRTTPGSAGRAA